MAGSVQDNDPEEFLFGNSLVVNLMQLIDDIGNSTQPQDTGKKTEKKGFSPPKINDENFIVVEAPEQSRFPDELKKSNRSSAKSSFIGLESGCEPGLDHTPLFNQFTFVNQIDCDPEQRAKVRAERERIANNFRTLGNHEYRQFKYKEAMFFYNKGLSAVHDTPVLYCNRGLCQAKLGFYEYALLDFDLVISKIDPGCLRAWLYRAACHQRLGNEKKFHESITMANHHNPEQKTYIEEFLVKLKAGNF